MTHLLEILKEAVEEKKALDPVILDLRGISSVTDYFLICSGKTAVQARAIADNIIDKINEAGMPLPPKEGYHEGLWILLDFGNVVAHIMQQQEREFYGLENLWHDAKVLEN
ncbi:MAG: ribosome silencing factor [Bacillota bacterium]